LSCGAKLSKTLSFSSDANANEEKRDNSTNDGTVNSSGEEKRASPTTSTSSSLAPSSRLVEEKARLDAEQSARDAADAAAAPDPNSVEWTYLCPPPDRLKVLRRQLIAKLEAEMTADAKARRNKKAAKKQAASVATTSATTTPSSTTSTTSGGSDVGGAGGTKRPRGVTETTGGDEKKTDNGTPTTTTAASGEAKKKRKTDVPRPPTNNNGKSKKQTPSTTTTSNSSSVKSLSEGRSEVYKSLFLPKDAHLRPSVPNFTSTKPASAMPALL
jgi:hypothetical protein